VLLLLIFLTLTAGVGFKGTQIKTTMASASEGQPYVSDERTRKTGEYELLLRGIECLKDCAIFTLTEDGFVSSWNDGAKNLKGYESHEIIGKHFSVFYTPEAQQQRLPWHELSEVTKKGRFEEEGWRVRKDGSVFWANVLITAIKDGDRLLGYLKVTRDLTERRLTEQQLRVLERGISEIKDYAILILSPEGIVLSWNAGAQQIKQYEPGEIVGKHFSMFYTKVDIERRWPDHELRVSKENGRFEDFGWRVRKDGTRFWANIIITPIYDDTEVHVGFTKITRDLTEKRLAEQKVRTLELGTAELQDYAILLVDSKERVVTCESLFIVFFFFFFILLLTRGFSDREPRRRVGLWSECIGSCWTRVLFAMPGPEGSSTLRTRSDQAKNGRMVA
jgi:PAS domain S-box-containing protein